MYTVKPKQKFAKASGVNLRISKKDSGIICKIIRRKKLSVVKRLLSDLINEKRSLQGKYYSKAVKEINLLLESCEKNAINLGLDTSKMFVHASATHGAIMRRGRRKAGFGSRMKTTNMEIMLIEKGKESEKNLKKQKPQEKKTEKKIAEKKEDKK